MKNLLIRWVILVVSLVGAAFLSNLAFPGQFTVEQTPQGILLAFVGVVVLAILNATLGRVLKFLTIPLNCLTLGLFSLVINAAMFFVAGNLGLGFKVSGFFGALVGSLLFSAINGVLGGLLIRDKDNKDEDK
ncbi:MAG: phage holin family protein [Armatimonadota bacterium]